MAKIAKVQVPMDFGIEYLGLPSHGNLKFLLKDGEEIYANSTVMSYNSPTIKKMTIEDGRTTTLVDVTAFSKDAVQCFLEASYSGNLTKISQTIFRDVNSMCHLFQVTWLSDKCFKYFQSRVDTVQVDNFPHQLYVYEEAMFILDKQERRDYLDSVIKKFTSQTACTEHFATNYLEDISSCSKRSLDVIMEMTANHAHVLVDVLVNNFEKRNSSLVENSRYILERLDLSICPPTYESSYRRLLEKLENIDSPSTEDYKLIVKILQQSNNALKQIREFVSFKSLPNLFHNFQQLKNIRDPAALTTFMVESSLATNIYIVFDAFYCWLLEKQTVGSPSVSKTDSFVVMLSEQLSKSKNRWGPLAREYIEHKTKPWSGGLTAKIQQNLNLVTENQYSLTKSISKYTPEEFFARDHLIKFRHKEESCTECNEAGDCGFILRVTAETEDTSFNIQLIIDPSLYPGDIHLHKESLASAEKLHMALDVTNHNGNGNRPVTWYGKPCRDGTNQYWSWGPYRFYTKGQGQDPPGDIFEQRLYYGSDVNIRPVIYLFD